MSSLSCIELIEEEPLVEIPSLRDLIVQGALFVCNHSGGKDSQAMYEYLCGIIPYDQLVVVHVGLGKVEWPGTKEHIDGTIHHPLNVVAAGKTFFEMVERRGKWPSPEQRQCTSDLKRGPVSKFFRREATSRGTRLVIDCLGLRAQESTNRSKLPAWKLNKKQTNSRRTVYTWHPILNWTIDEVWATHGHTVLELQERQGWWQLGDYDRALSGWNFHWVYLAGMERCSCSFCIMAKDADLKCAATLRPDLLAEYAALERRINHTFRMPRKNKPRQFLDELCAAPEGPRQPGPISLLLAGTYPA